MFRISDIMKKEGGPKEKSPSLEKERAEPPRQEKTKRDTASTTDEGRVLTPRLEEMPPKRPPDPPPVRGSDGEKPSGQESSAPRHSFLFARNALGKNEPLRPSALASGGQADSKREEAVSHALKASEEDQAATAEAIYNRGLALAKDVINKLKQGGEVELAPISSLVDEIVRELQFGHEHILSLAFCVGTEKAPEGYMYRGMINVTILSIRLGIGKAFNKSKLVELGLVGFFHDIGLVGVIDLVTREEVLSEKDRALIKEHPRQSVEILKKVKDLPKAVIKGVYQSHERLDGSGYPLGVDDPTKLSELARIVSVVDLFESLTQDRPFRKAMAPHEALRFILEKLGVHKFEESVLKVLIDQIGLYPIGNWVKLNNKEMGTVVGLNVGQPLRPKVRIFFNDAGEPVDSSEGPVIVDLNKSPLLRIARTLTEDEKKELAR